MLNDEFRFSEIYQNSREFFLDPSCTIFFNNYPEKKFGKGLLIANRANLSKDLYLVTKGIVKLETSHFHKNVLENYFHAGELLNPMAIITPFKKKLTASAMVTNTCVKKMPVTTFKEVLKTHPSLYHELITHINTAQKRTQERIFRMTFLSAAEKVYDVIVKYTLNLGRKVGFEYVIKPTLSHADLGIIAGVGRQTATTVLNDLRKKGIIHYNRRYLIIRDLQALQAMVPSN